VSIADRMLELLTPLISDADDDDDDRGDDPDEHSDELVNLLRWLRIDRFDRRMLNRQLAQLDSSIKRVAA